MRSDEPCPSEPKFVSLFVKGLERKFKQLPKKAHPISHDELSIIFSKTLGDSDLESLSFVKLRLVTILLTFSHYEEIINLTLGDVVREELGFILTFKKGKSYQFSESHIGIVSNLPNLKFNPARIFSIFLDRVAPLHAHSSHSSDLLFPSCKVVKLVETSLPKPVSYSVIKRNPVFFCCF